MQIFDADTEFLHVIGQILCHTLGQGCDHYLIMLCCLLTNLGDQIVDLSFYRSYFYIWIQESRRTDHLLSAEHLMLSLIVPWCCRHEEHLVYLGLEFTKV